MPCLCVADWFCFHFLLAKLLLPKTRVLNILLLLSTLRRATSFLPPPSMSKRAASTEANRPKRAKPEAVPEPAGEALSKEPEVPTTVSQYRRRLVDQSKEIYKDPPVLPVASAVEVTSTTAKAPTRSSNGDYTFAGFSTFRPNRSPEEVLREGGFGGTYYRSILSAVTNVKYKGSSVLKTSVRLREREQRST